MKKFLYFLFAFLFMTVEVNAAYPGKETSAVATVPAVNDTEVTATEYLDTTFALERKRGKVLDFIDQCFPSENSDGELLDKVCVEELRKPFRDYNAKIHYFLRKKAATYLHF